MQPSSANATPIAFGQKRVKAANDNAGNPPVEQALNTIPQVDLENLDSVRAELLELITTARSNVARFGARVVVHSSFIEAVLPGLTAAQRKETVLRFRQCIENAMANTDDVAMSAEYHATFLTETNLLLDALGS
jgi:hypothetical protein